MNGPKLVVINTKTNECKAYEGRTIVDQATFSRMPEGVTRLKSFASESSSSRITQHSHESLTIAL